MPELIYPARFMFFLKFLPSYYGYICCMFAVSKKHNLYILASFAMLLAMAFSCNSSGEQAEATQEDAQDSTAIYGSASIMLPKINAAATPIVNDWSIFDDFENELVAINTLSLAEIRSRSERLVSFSDSLVKTVPDTLADQSVISRLTVLKTRVRLLDQAVNSERPKSAAISECFKELNMSLANLKIRINEKLLKDKINLDRRESEAAEREKQQAKLDSIAAAESGGNS